MDSGPTTNYRIVGVSPGLIQIEVIDAGEFKKGYDSGLSIGTYLRISDDNDLSILAVVQSYRLKQERDVGATLIPRSTFIIDAQPVGVIGSDGRFRRGGQQIAIPPTHVECADSDRLVQIYTDVDASKRLIFGALSQDPSVPVAVDGDKFFSKHIAVVGSTGSGKSCTVAKIIQEGISPSVGQTRSGILNNSHVVIFDIHGEYGSAFPKASVLSIENLALPYWLLNSEELEEMFVEISNEQNHNQRSQFRQAVIANKRRHNSDMERVSYDAPIYFSLKEVCNYLWNLNSEVIGKGANEDRPKIRDISQENGTRLIESRELEYFDDVLEFVQPSQAAATRASNGPFHGDFDRFLLRLDAKLNDDRLRFLLAPRRPDGNEYITADLPGLLQQFFGYATGVESNVVVFDLSGIPFEVLNIVVSLLSRLIFDFYFHFRRLRSKELVTSDGQCDWPVLVVYEEAHNYIPREIAGGIRSVKKSIERIAKEGRKYGVSLMIVSQRPSEISETIFSQCNNVVAMRLTNSADQNFVQRMAPDSVSAVAGSLPILDQREALVP